MIQAIAACLAFIWVLSEGNAEGNGFPPTAQWGLREEFERKENNSNYTICRIQVFILFYCYLFYFFSFLFLSIERTRKLTGQERIHFYFYFYSHFYSHSYSHSYFHYSNLITIMVLLPGTPIEYLLLVM